MFRRTQLKALVDMHGADEGLGGNLTGDEVKVRPLLAAPPAPPVHCTSHAPPYCQRQRPAGLSLPRGNAALGNRRGCEVTFRQRAARAVTAPLARPPDCTVPLRLAAAAAAAR